MNTVRKILVPIDFSEDSATGLKYAVSLAQKTQAELTVMHVTQKEEADSFVDLLAVMEGACMLALPLLFPSIVCCARERWIFVVLSRRSS